MSLGQPRRWARWAAPIVTIAALVLPLAALSASAKPAQHLHAAALRAAAQARPALERLQSVRARKASSSPCTMTGAGVFTVGGNQIHKEDSLSTDLTAKQQLVIRSLSGPAHFFRLASLTAASCRNNTHFPPEETGTPVNFFDGTGTGSFGSSATTTSPGYTVRIEVGDLGDSTSSDDGTKDAFSFSVMDSTGKVVWSGRGTLTSGNEEISQAAVVAGSCEPSSSLSVMVQGKNVTSYVPKGNWGTATTGVSAVNVEGSSITPTLIATPNPVNSVASNPLTGTSVAVANNSDVYLLNGTSLTKTLSSGGTGTIGFSGGDCTNCGVAMDATHNRAVIGLSDGGTAAFQFLDLSSQTFGTPIDSPAGEISEDPLIDPIRNLLLSADENNNYEIADVTNPASPKFYENPGIPAGGILDSSGEDCSTGIALAPAEGSSPSNVFIADLTQATFTPGSPSGTWTAPSQVQSLSGSNLSAGASGIAVAQGTHTGVVNGEFGGNALTAFTLPSTSGTGTPAITDWVTCTIGNTPDGNPWSTGFDPHTVTAYQSPNSADAMSLVANDTASWLAKVDLTQLLNPAITPRDSSGHFCAAGTIPSTAESFISVP